MATIRDVSLDLTDVDSPPDHVRARVSVQVAFTDAEISEREWFRLTVELMASDAAAGEGVSDWPVYPLFTFVFMPPGRPFALPALLLATPYKLLQAEEDPAPIEAMDDIALAQLDEDPGLGERTEGGGGEVVRHTLRDEVYALARITPALAVEAKSSARIVPGSERLVRDFVVLSPVFTNWL